jgi:hypothetical protein
VSKRSMWQSISVVANNTAEARARVIRSTRCWAGDIGTEPIANLGPADGGQAVGLLRVLLGSRGLGRRLWLGSRDSNPNYLIQSQASYR